MATKTKRRKSLIDPTNAQELQTFARQYLPESIRDKALEAIRLKGSIPEEILKEGNFSDSNRQFVTSEISRITGGKPLERDLYRSELEQELLGPKGKPVDEVGLTDEELSGRRDIYEQLSGAKNELSGFPGQIEETLKRKLNAYGVSGSAGDEVTKAIKDIVVQKGYYPQADELRNALNERRKSEPLSVDVNSGPLGNFINDQDARNELSSYFESLTGPQDRGEDVTRIEDLLSTRKTGKEREGQIDEFLGSIPQQLSETRNSRVDMLRELGGREFEDLAPRLMAQENVLRGDARTGAAGDVLASGFGDIQSRIEGEAANLASGDEAFYFDAAYKNQVRKLMEGRQDLGQALSFEKQNVRAGQEQRFQNSQFDLNSSLKNDLMRQTYENQIRQSQALRQRQQEMLNKQRSSGMAGAFGGLGGTLLGAGLGAALAVPTGGLSVAAGAGLGAGVGGGIGAGLPSLFGSQR